MIIKIIALGSLFLFATPVFSETNRAGEMDFYTGAVPTPYLIAPMTKEVNLVNEDALEFKWSPHEGTAGFRQYYDFRLYKGYNELESALMVKKELPADAYQVRLSSELFEDDQVYTWTLRQVYSESRSSKPNYSSFKVIKTEDAEAIFH